MNTNPTKPAAAQPCASEACARAAEPGEIYCGDCGLERSLYFRDSRVERSHLAEDLRADAERN